MTLHINFNANVDIAFHMLWTHFCHSLPLAKSVWVCVCSAKYFVSIFALIRRKLCCLRFEFKFCWHFLLRERFLLLLLSLCVMTKALTAAATLVVGGVRYNCCWTLAEQKTFSKHWFRIFYFVAGDLHIEDLIWTINTHSAHAQRGSLSSWSTFSNTDTHTDIKHLTKVTENICRLLIKNCIHHLKLTVWVGASECVTYFEFSL